MKELLRRIFRFRPIEIDVRCLEVRPGDSLVLTTPHHLSEEAVRCIKAQMDGLRDRLGIRIVLVLENGMDVKVVRPVEAQREPRPPEAA